MRVIALATCHNRRRLTMRAIRSLYRQVLPGEFTLDICLVDDGSSDGTSSAVRDAFPDVTVLRGTGELYWAGGMRFGWENYVRQKQPDYLLVFNDDSCFREDAIKRLCDVANELEANGVSLYAIAGALLDPATGGVAYGGAVRASRWHPLRFRIVEPELSVKDCDTLNMNFALISAAALAKIGFLSKEFVHAKADFDFGLRLRSAGGRVVLAPGYIGECNRNSIKGTSLERGVSFMERWRRLTSLKEQEPRIRAMYYRRHGGRAWPCFWALPYVRTVFEGLALQAKRYLKR